MGSHMTPTYSPIIRWISVLACLALSTYTLTKPTRFVQVVFVKNNHHHEDRLKLDRLVSYLLFNQPKRVLIVSSTIPR